MSDTILFILWILYIICWWIVGIELLNEEKGDNEDEKK